MADIDEPSAAFEPLAMLTVRHAMLSNYTTTFYKWLQGVQSAYAAKYPSASPFEIPYSAIPELLIRLRPLNIDWWELRAEDGTLLAQAPAEIARRRGYDGWQV